jgi:hypothetical protein
MVAAEAVASTAAGAALTVVVVAVFMAAEAAVAADLTAVTANSLSLHLPARFVFFGAGLSLGPDMARRVPFATLPCLPTTLCLTPC